MSETAAAAPAANPPAAPAKPAAKPVAKPSVVETVEVKTNAPAFLTVPQAIERIRSDNAKAKEEHRKKVAAQVGTYRVTLGDLSGEYRARNASDAWALFNDAHKTSYGPKHPARKVERIDPVKAS